MRAHPAAAAPYLALGRTFALLGRRADAIAALQAGRRHAPDGVALVLALADALAEDGQARAALALLRAATQRHDGLAILEARGRLARELGAWSEAADAYAAVVDLSRRDDTVPPESVRQAELLLAAIAILLNDEHPRARACATAARAAEGARSRWTRALAGCTPP
jgi:tetratricopeptide (TPR) repeat protein